MSFYEKPNVILPISLHDTRLTRIEIHEDTVVFVLAEGFFRIMEDRVEQTGEARISFPKVDLDFCRVFCTGQDQYRKQWDIKEFSEEMKARGMAIEIVDETYGYNQAKFGCTMIVGETWFDCEIELYHFGLMKYTWEERDY